MTPLDRTPFKYKAYYPRPPSLPQKKKKKKKKRIFWYIFSSPWLFDHLILVALAWLREPISKVTDHSSFNSSFKFNIVITQLNSFTNEGTWTVGYYNVGNLERKEQSSVWKASDTTSNDFGWLHSSTDFISHTHSHSRKHMMGRQGVHGFMGWVHVLPLV